MATVKSTTFGSLEALEVKNTNGGCVKVALYGGTIVSYTDSNGRERLFVSDKAVTDGSKPIRGGVPLVFPQFGDGQGKYPSLPSHGFARRSKWTFQGGSPSGVSSEDAMTNTDGSVTFYMILKDSEEIRQSWNHPFKLTLKVTFDDSNLATELSVENPGTEGFEFQALLHTYYLLSAVENIAIQGLKGLTYIDQLQGRNLIQEEGQELAIDKETDWIYTNATKPLRITGVDDTNIEININLKKADQSQPVDAVVWNPWIDKSKGMGDFGDAEYHRMICVEPGCVSRFETCEPGQKWTLSQNISFPM